MRRPRPCPRAGPAPSDQTGVAPCEAVYFLAFPKVVCKDVGGPSPVGPWSLPRPALSRSASASG